MSTLMPCSVASRLMSASMSVRCIGSRPSVGSSKITSSGWCATAWASFTRWRWPVDMVPMGRKRSSPRPTSQSVSLARCVAATFGSPCSRAMCATKSAAVMSPGS